MANPLATTFETYNDDAIREDLSDLIADISPTQTPFQSNVGTRDADNTYFEWQTDALADADATATIEGNNLETFTAVTATDRLGNYCQINMRDFIISGTEQTVLSAGRASEVGYQAAKAAKELKRNVEKAALLNGVGAVVGSSGTARVTAGLPGWLKTNQVSTAVTAPSYTGSSTPTGADTGLEEFWNPHSVYRSHVAKCYATGVYQWWRAIDVDGKSLQQNCCEWIYRNCSKSVQCGWCRAVRNHRSSRHLCQRLW